MSEPAYLSATRAAYDTIAVDYAEFMSTEPPETPLDLAMLAAFAQRVRSAGTGPVADLQVGNERRHIEQGYGHTVSLDGYRFSPDDVAELLDRAGLVVHARMLREPEMREKVHQAVLLFRKPAMP